MTAKRPDWVAAYSLAGALSNVTPRRTRWAERSGDKHQDIAFIGAGVDRAARERRLDARLLAEHTANPATSADLPAPFPNWRSAGAVA